MILLFADLQFDRQMTYSDPVLWQETEPVSANTD